MLPQQKSDEETQNRNSMFQRLNKLANTRLLKSFIAGQQLIDLHEDSTLFKSTKMVKILEERAHKAIDTLKKKKKMTEDGLILNNMDESVKKNINFTKRIASEVDVPRRPLLKSKGSLQIVDKPLFQFRSSHKKSSNAIIQKYDSFEIEGPKNSNDDIPEEKEPEIEISEKFEENLDKKEEIKENHPEYNASIDPALEDLYDIRKSTNFQVSTLMLENQQENSKIDEIINETSPVAYTSTTESTTKRALRKGFSYSDFEGGGNDNKRKITFDKKFDEKIKHSKILAKIKKKIKDFFDISVMKMKIETSFVDVVITSEKTREIDVILQQKKIILLPGSYVKWLSDFWMSMLAFYVLFSTPVYIAFFFDETYLSIVGIVFECIFSFLFLLDIWLNFRTGYINKRGVLELYPTKIIFQYLRTNFIYDLISTFPIIPLFPDNSYLRLIYLLRLFKIVRLYKILSRIREFTSIHPGFIRIIKCFIILIILCHNFACFYWYISILEGFNTDDWVPPIDIATSSAIHQYAYSMFFAITVTIGVGINISPVTLCEIIYSFFSIIIGVFMYGMLLGSATSALMSLDEEDSDIRKQLDSLNGFMRKKKVPLQLQKRIQENLKYLWSSNQSLNITNQWFLKGVHPLLKLELMLQINRRYLEKVPLFKNLNFEGMINLISLLETRIYLPDEFVVYENSITEEMYFIQSGMLEVFDAKRSLKIRLFEGDFFGEQAIINRNSKRGASIKSIVYSELLILSRKGLEIIILENQAFGRRLFSYLKKKIMNNFNHNPKIRSKWSLLYMIKKAAFNIKRMNPDITIESLFIPRSTKYYNPKTPIVRTIIKDLDRIEETEASKDPENECDEEEVKRPKTAKHRQFQENVYQTTSQLSELVRSVMKDKKEIAHNRHKSGQPDEMNEIIEDIESKKSSEIHDNPYGNYDYTNESFERKKAFVSGKTLDERTPKKP